MSHKPETLSHAIVRLERIRKQRDQLLAALERTTNGEHEPTCEYRDTAAFDNMPGPRHTCCGCYTIKQNAARELIEEIQFTIRHKPPKEAQ